MSSRKGSCFPCSKCCRKSSAKEEETKREEDREGLLDRPENTSEEIPAGSTVGNVTAEGIERVGSSHISNITVKNSGPITGNELEPGVETGTVNDCSPANIHEFNEILKKKIRNIFREYITSKNILYVFHKYNVAVLSEADIIDVKCEINKKGPIEGGYLLLDRLVVYKGWFQCLIQVLRDPKVRLLPAAEMLEQIQDELCIKYPELIKVTENAATGETQIEETTQSLIADNPKNVKGQKRYTRYIPSEVNIFQEIIVKARQDNKIMLEEIIRLNDIKADLHQSLKSKDIQVEEIANINEELSLRLKISQEETQTLIRQIGELNLRLEASHEDKQKMEQEKDHLTSQLQVCQEEIEKSVHEKENLEKEVKSCKDDLDLVCDSCKRNREIKLMLDNAAARLRSAMESEELMSVQQLERLRLAERTVDLFVDGCNPERDNI